MTILEQEFEKLEKTIKAVSENKDVLSKIISHSNFITRHFFDNNSENLSFEFAKWRNNKNEKFTPEYDQDGFELED